MKTHVECDYDAENKKIVVTDKDHVPGPRTVPFDPRFPNTNQTKNCYQNYLDFFRCQKVKGTDYKPCLYYEWAYLTLCPPAWVEKWNEQREKGIFPGKI